MSCEWHTDDDKAWEAEMNDPDRGLVDAFGVKPDFVVGSPDAIPKRVPWDENPDYDEEDE